MKCFCVTAAIVFSGVVYELAVQAGESVAPPSEEMRAVDRVGPLARYLSNEDSSYHWDKVRGGDLGGVEYVELILTSQTWRGIVWKHRLFIIKPTSAAGAKQAVLVIAGGKWKDEFEDATFQDNPGKEAALFARIAEQFQSPVAILLQVPQQPLFSGMVEDEIISHTFDQYLKTQDPEWPLLLPMVKSAVRGMDAVQEFCQTQWSLDIESFTVTGGSKRGWTTWLAGASDRRVSAIAPMVIDTLDMPRQMDHQLEAWGEFSEQIKDYTRLGIQQRMHSPAGRELVQIVDPLAYRQLLTLPKLIIIGTNDRYWPLDALNLYWDQLLGPKYILYVPNNRHGLKDFSRVLGGIVALHEQSNGGDTLPNLTWSFSETSDQVTLSIKSDITPIKCQVWSAKSETKDFRDSLWTSSKLSRSDDGYTFQVDIPETGSTAFFGEVSYARKHLPLYLSTNLRIISSAEAAAPHYQQLRD